MSNRLSFPRCLLSLLLVTPSAMAAALTGNVYVTVPGTPTGLTLYDVLFSDATHSFRMSTRYSQDVALFAYSPVVFSGFGGSCALPVVTGPSGLSSPGCDWNSSRNHLFEYWTPGFFGDPAPMGLEVETPAGLIRYGVINPTTDLFHFLVRLRFTGGPTALPATVAGAGGSSVTDLPVTFLLDIALLRWPAGQGLPADRWWESAGECIWCASYAGTGTAEGRASLSLSGGSNAVFYDFAGEQVPEPASWVLGALGLGYLALGRRAWAKRRR